MKKTEIVKLLRPWKRAHSRLQRCADSTTALFGGCAPEGEMMAAHVEAFAGWTSSLSRVIGDSDRWLEWFAWENDMGARGMGAQAPGWDAMRPMKTLGQFADLIIACRS